MVKVNDNTVDFIMKGPNPVLLNQLTELRIMSKAWAEKNKSVEPKDIRTKDETFAHRNAMGTGQFMVKEWQPDQKLVLVNNPNYWGKVRRNVTEIIYTPIKSEATRVAALLSGEVDFVLDPSPQDLARLRASANLKVIDGVENRTIFFGMDQFRDELPGSNVKGKNPLKDVRVRKALYQAIDSDSLHARDHARPGAAHRHARRAAGQRLDRGGAQAPALTTRRPPRSCWPRPAIRRASKSTSPARTTATSTTRKSARPSPRCGRASACKAKLRTLPLVTYFPMIQRYEASIYMLGWGVPTFDALYSLQSLTRSVGTGRRRQLQRRPLQQSADGRRGRPHQGRDRPAGAQPLPDRRRCS